MLRSIEFLKEYYLSMQKDNREYLGPGCYDQRIYYDITAESQKNGNKLIPGNKNDQPVVKIADYCKASIKQDEYSGLAK
jgi:hypothetical protein